MFEDLKLFPQAASSIAGDVDALLFALLGVAVFFTTLIALAIVVMSARYRQRAGHRARQVEGSIPLEILWSAIPLAISLTFFGWGAKIYYDQKNPPEEAMQFLVTGKQWMWRVQHPTGHREINALHVPVGETIELTMTSEDVIHDFFVPAFRVKSDVVPGMYSTLWFRPTKIGTYHLFCAEYCGTKHSEMVGSVFVMDPVDYERWLAGQPVAADPVESGRVLFENLRCDTCHAAGSGQRGPDLKGRFGKPARLADGQSVLFDESYVRESILEPKKRLTAGYEPLMPTYEGQVTEEQILHLVAYIRSIAEPPDAETGNE